MSFFRQNALKHSYSSRRFNSTTTSKHVKNVLHVTARHSDMSIVASASNELFNKWQFKYAIQERNLWKEALVPYSIKHVEAKFRIMKGIGTEEDVALFKPVKTLAEEMNAIDILVISTPMWNMSVPYILKQYIDIVIQPGLNFKESKEWPEKITPISDNKSLVVIYSTGANVGDDALTSDFVGPELKNIFQLVGFTNCHILPFHGAMGKPREQISNEIAEKTDSVANSLNKKFILC